MDVKVVSQGGQGLQNYNNSSNEKITELSGCAKEQYRSSELIHSQQSSSPKDKNITEDEVRKAVEKFNKLLEDKPTHIEYEQDESFKSIMIMKVVDNATNKVVKEIPSKQILDMVAQFCEMAGLILNKKA